MLVLRIFIGSRFCSEGAQDFTIERKISILGASAYCKWGHSPPTPRSSPYLEAHGPLPTSVGGELGTGRCWGSSTRVTYGIGRKQGSDGVWAADTTTTIGWGP